MEAVNSASVEHVAKRTLSRETLNEIPLTSAAASVTSVLTRFEQQSLRNVYLRNVEEGDLLLERLYPVYAAGFSDENEVASKELLKELVTDSAASWDVTVITHEKKVLSGYCNALVKHNGAQYGLGRFIFVDSAYRGCGLGGELLDTAIENFRKSGCVAYFAEINDPLLMSPAQIDAQAQSGVSPQKRIEYWAKKGRLAVDTAWIQPALAQGAESVDYLMLTVIPLCKNFQQMDVGTLVAVWKDFYDSCRGGPAYFQAFRSLNRGIAGRDLIPFVPLTQRRSFISVS